MSDASAQSFTNHTRWDPPFHFILMPFALVSVIGMGWRLWVNQDLKHVWLFLFSLAFMGALLKVRLNALKVQDRVIRLEETLRLTRLGAAATVIGALQAGQFVALRFASDGEVVALAQRAVTEQLEPKVIKAAIKDWRADNFRV